MTAGAEWARTLRGLRFGQVFEGTFVKVPRPGAIGIFVDIGLGVGGFVDVLLLPERADERPGGRHGGGFRDPVGRPASADPAEAVRRAISAQ